MNKRLLLAILGIMLTTTITIASGDWGRTIETRAFSAMKKSAQSMIYLGHCSPNDQIWPWDGISNQRDGRIGAGIRLTKEMIQDYAGMKIESMYVGYDDETTTSYYECFVRKNSFIGEDITTGEGEVYFGWNDIQLEEATIPSDAESLCVGFYMEASANLCQIPSLYPKDKANACYLWDGQSVDKNGEEQWMDGTGMANLAIVLVLNDENGDFKNIAVIDNLRTDVVVDCNEEAKTGIFQISNAGSNEITSLEVTTTFGEHVMSQEVEFEKPLQSSSWIRTQLPVYCFGSGEHTISFTKVNGEEPKKLAEYQMTFIGVPESVSSAYTFRPLVEFYVSEESYMTPSHIMDMFMPGIEQFKDDFTVVMPHLDDKYMFVVEEEDQEEIMGQMYDDAGMLALYDLAGKDPMKIYVPQFLLNRSDYTFLLATIPNTPFHNGTPYEQTATFYYEEILKYPTFASVNVDSELDESGEHFNIKVYGDVAEDVMPAGEPLYLTVYVTEHDVVSLDQLFWDDNQKGEYNGEFTHPTIIREILTPMYGAELQSTGGEYMMEFKSEIDHSEWDVDNMHIVAFLNRGKSNSNMERQVINSIEVNASQSGVEQIESNQDRRIEIVGGTVMIGGEPARELYNLSGSKVSSSNLTPGVYIVKTDAGCKKIFVK